LEHVRLETSEACIMFAQRSIHWCLATGVKVRENVQFADRVVRVQIEFIVAPEALNKLASATAQ
jgi:hypothetical protein